MVAFCHRHSVPPPVLVVILLLELCPPALCQVGLRTLPLTATHNRSSNFGLLSKWSGNGPSNPSANGPSIEMELAAILRDIAYGISTEPTTSTTTTTTTTSRPTTPRYFDKSRIPPPSSIPVSPPWEENWWGSEPQGKHREKPVDLQYVDSPVKNPEGNSGGEQEEDDFHYIDEYEPGIAKNDGALNYLPWLNTIGVMWEVHVYTTAGLFTLLVLLSLYCLTRVYLSSQLLPRGYYITVHLLIFLAAFFRCVYFFHDPYAIRKLLPDGLSNILFNTGTPCIITALAVLILALLRTARLIILPLNLQSPVVVAVISGALIAGSIIIDVFGGLLKEQQIAPGLKGIMQALTAGWGAALCIGYIIVFIRIERAAKRQQNEILRLTFSRLHIEGSSLPRRLPKSSLKIGARFTLIASISGILLATLQVYGLINTDTVIEHPPLQPWLWLVYQACCRILEITMWACVCIASALPANLSKKERNKSGLDESQFLTVFSCKKCASCMSLISCCAYEKSPTDDMYSTICQSNHVARNLTIHKTEKLIPQDTIASTGVPPKNISTTLLHQKPRKSINKQSALNSAGSDAQLLWNNASNANSSNSSSRPSSLILTEGGLIKFRTHDPHNETVRILNYPIKEYDPKFKINETPQKVLGNSVEDNYINSGAFTPDEKRMLEKGFIRSYHRKDIEENHEYTDIIQEKTSNERIQKFVLNPSSSVNNTESSQNPGTRFGVHFYDDGESRCYQSPSLDSSLESNSHIYASIQQPLEQHYYAQHPMDQHHYAQQQRKLSDANNHSGKIFNNTNFQFPNHGHQRNSSSSNHSQLDIIQTDYLTDASQDHTESPSDLPHNVYLGSPGYFQPADFFYQPKSNMSPVHGLRCYVPEYQLEGSINSPEHSIGTGKNQEHYEDDKSNVNNELEVVTGQCPISPSPIKRFVNKVSSHNFENVSYSPLPGEEEQYPQPKEGIIRISVHRPRKEMLSPSFYNDSSKSIAIDLNTSAHHRPAISAARSPISDDTETEVREIGKTVSFFSSQMSPREKVKHKARDDLNRKDTNVPIDPSPVNPHKFLSEGVPWADLRSSPKTPTESLSRNLPFEKSSSDFQSEYIEVNDDSTKKSMEVRWPLKCKDGTGVYNQ